jgi:hypothetical protein
MTTELTLLDLLLSFLLGLSALAVVSRWQSQSLIPLLLYYTLSGLVGVLFMLGLLILGNRLACWLTTFF